MKTILIIITAAAALALGGAALAQDAGTEPAPASDRAITKPALPADLQELIKAYRHSRGDLLRARVRLMEKLKACTDREQRAQLVAKFRADMRQSLKEQAQLRKQIRRELMQLRRERRRAAADGG